MSGFIILAGFYCCWRSSLFFGLHAVWLISLFGFSCSGLFKFLFASQRTLLILVLKSAIHINVLCHSYNYYVIFIYYLNNSIYYMTYYIYNSLFPHCCVILSCDNVEFPPGIDNVLSFLNKIVVAVACID